MVPAVDQRYPGISQRTLIPAPSTFNSLDSLACMSLIQANLGKLNPTGLCWYGHFQNLIREDLTFTCCMTIPHLVARSCLTVSEALKYRSQAGWYPCLPHELASSRKCQFRIHCCIKVSWICKWIKAKSFAHRLSFRAQIKSSVPSQTGVW